MALSIKELQIGDLVMYNGCFVRVYSIQSPLPRRDRLSDKSVITLFLNGLIDASEDEIEPIPITEEILKKNGFKLCKYSSIEYKLHVKDGVVDYNVFVAPARSKMVIELADTEHTIFDWFVDTVHELRRVLRCCGLWDLAENFKI